MDLRPIFGPMWGSAIEQERMVFKTLILVGGAIFAIIASNTIAAMYGKSIGTFALYVVSIILVFFYVQILMDFINRYK